MRIRATTAIAVAWSIGASSAFAQSATPSTKTNFLPAQAAGEARASKLIGVVVKNKAGDVVGDINDVVLQPSGQAIAYIIGVGGVLGVGEKNVAVPYGDVALTADKDGKRSAVLDTSKAALEAAPVYISERTTFEQVEDGAASLAKATAKKARELANEASKAAQSPSQAPAPTPSPDAPK